MLAYLMTLLIVPTGVLGVGEDCRRSCGTLIGSRDLTTLSVPLMAISILMVKG